MDNTALEQFLILAKSAKGRAACALCQQVKSFFLQAFRTVVSPARRYTHCGVSATASPTCFHFGELLEHPNIAALADNPETKPSLDLLRIFAYGTYNDYIAHQSTLGPLDECQTTKLRMLTVVSLAAENRVIKYETVLKSLGLSDTRTLEDLLIEGMYVGLFSGKLDQKRQEFQVHETAGRDCKPGQLAEMIATLKAWVQATENVTAELTDKISYAERSQESELLRVQAYTRQVEEVRKTLAVMQQGDSDVAPGGGHMESMDTDDVSRPKSRPKTKHPSGFLAVARH